MIPTTMPESTPPNLARRLFRAGQAGFTTGWSEGFVQANLIAVPADAARDLGEFIEANPRPCPLLDRTLPGATTTTLAPGADLRTDLPAYLVWENGECVARATDVTGHWRDDLVTFLLGCSFTFESALRDAGIPIRHLEQGVNVPMYRTNRPCVPAGRLHGPLVVSMRPIPEALVPLAEAVTARYPAMHGAPVHIGSPADLGIADLDCPDYGDRVQAQPGDVPVFWACGVTPQAAVMASRPPFAISHAPGHMLITDLRHEAFRI